jgi:hypothetical protein
VDVGISDLASDLFDPVLAKVAMGPGSRQRHEAERCSRQFPTRAGHFELLRAPCLELRERAQAETLMRRPKTAMSARDVLPAAN